MIYILSDLISGDKYLIGKTDGYIHILYLILFSWTNDGQYIALGLFNGTVSIRSKVIYD